MVATSRSATVGLDSQKRSRPLAGLGKHRPRVFLATFADGSTRAISRDIDPKVFHTLVTRAGGEVVDRKRVFGER